MLRRVLLLLLAISSTAPALAAPDALVKLDPKVHDALAATAAFYAARNTMEVDIASTLNIAMTGMKNEMDSTFHLAVSRPNSLSFVLQSGMMGGELISDGKHLVTYSPILHKYTSIEAPADVSTMLDPPGFAMAEGTPLSMGIDTFLRRDPLAGFDENLKSSQDLGIEQLNGTPAHHVQLVNMPYTTDLWLATDAAAPVLLQVRSSMDMSATLRRLTPEQKKSLPANANVNSMTMNRLTTFSNWKFDQPLAPDTFIFHAPPDAQLTTEFFPRPTHALVGKPAPAFTATTLDGKDVSLASLRGKVVVLDFWATWCGPCVASLPNVTQVTASLRDRGVVFYAVNDKENAADITAFQKGKGLAFPVLLDPDGKVNKSYLANSIPQTVLIDKHGRIQAVHVGYDPNMKQVLSQQLTDLLAGKDLAAAKVK